MQTAYGWTQSVPGMAKVGNCSEHATEWDNPLEVATEPERKPCYRVWLIFPYIIKVEGGAFYVPDY